MGIGFINRFRSPISSVRPEEAALGAAVSKGLQGLSAALLEQIVAKNSRQVPTSESGAGTSPSGTGEAWFGTVGGDTDA
jgi:hypothetical protein